MPREKKKTSTKPKTEVKKPEVTKPELPEVKSVPPMPKDTKAPAPAPVEQEDSMLVSVVNTGLTVGAVYGLVALGERLFGLIRNRFFNSED